MYTPYSIALAIGLASVSLKRPSGTFLCIFGVSMTSWHECTVNFRGSVVYLNAKLIPIRYRFVTGKCLQQTNPRPKNKNSVVDKFNVVEI